MRPRPSFAMHRYPPSFPASIARRPAPSAACPAARSRQPTCRPCRIGAHDKGRIGQRIDQFVALHGVADIEPGAGIIGRDQHQLAIEQPVAVLAVHRRLFQAVRQHADGIAARLQRAAHRRLVDASWPRRRRRPCPPVAASAPNVHRVVDQRVVDIARSDDGQSARFQQAPSRRSRRSLRAHLLSVGPSTAGGSRHRRG